MSNYVRDLSNLSYTNKDFAEIYPELLDLAKKISYKWDPSLSDESDPGVVLLKLAALMADKCNYNIDKNVLELFPVSVTQLSNARQLFEQCGYNMRYYESATTNLSLRMLNEPEITDDDVTAMLGTTVTYTANTLKTDSSGELLRHYIIPRFSMFSDVDNSVVYTTTEDVTIFSDGTTSTVPVIQGAVSEYLVNGSNIITVDMLDSNNRVYFTQMNIPENGIFISNVGSAERWSQCNNLLLEPLGTHCYKFGLTLDGLRCYVEFPSDIDTIIGNGINIHYVQTAGTDGNVRKNFIRQFFSDPVIIRKIGSSMLEQETDLTTDNIYITNEDAAVNGRNPETISEAYQNYERVKTTFETLVSTKDYTDFLITNKDVSNCVVCDRYDDVQSAYTVLTEIDGEPQQIPHTKTHMKEYQVAGSASLDGGKSWLSNNVLVKYESEEPEMTAFDLRVYGLRYVDGFTDYKSFSRSFDILDSRIHNSIDSSTASVKCLAHDYKPFEADRIILLKNRYPIVARVVSPYKLTLAQQDEILSRIKLNLFNLLNSRAIKFGEEVDYNEVYNTILKSDPRVSAVILEEIVYETYAVYFSSSTQSFELMRIDSKSVPPDSTKEEERARLKSLWNDFRTEVYTRSVLSGNTPLFVPDSVFVYSLAHEQAQNGDLTYEVETMSTSVNIPLTYNGLHTLTSRELKDNDVITLTSPNLIMDKRYANYVQYVTNIGCIDGRHPNYEDANLVVVEKDEEYVLQEGEYIIFFWRTSDSSTECYTYVKYTGRKSTPVIICPSFDMIQQPNTANLSNVIYRIDDDYFESLGDYGSDYSDGIQLTVPRTEMYPQANGSFVDKTLVPKDYKDENNNIVVPPPEITLNDFINRYLIGEKFNVKSNTIETRKINEIHLTAEDNGTSKFYWILNTVTDGKYRLFPASSTSDDDEYTLQEGEQLIYSNDNLTQLYILGAGTLIRRHKKATGAACGAWEVPALEHTLEFLSVGPHYFENTDHAWFNIKKQAARFELYATEMAYRKLGAKTRLSIHIPTENGSELELQNAKYFIGSSGIITDQGIDSGFKSHLVTYTVINEFGEEEKLAIRKHKSLEWSVTSSLNLKLSTTTPMRLYAHQKLSWLPYGGYNLIEIEGSDSEEFYIQSDRTVTKSGGSNLDVRYYDVLTESYVPLQIYIYKLKDVNLSSSEDTNNYDLPWQFSSDGITVSGKDVTLTNISLPEGDYILPITMSNVNYPVDVYWNELRKLRSSKLTEDEANELVNLQLVPRSALQLADSDWNSARKPVELADVVKWLYGSVSIDVSDEFQNETIVSAFKKMFVTQDTTLQDPNADTTNNFSVRSRSDVEANALLLDMLVGYGGSKFTSTKTDICKIGDVIALRIDTDTAGLPEFKYQIWVYMPCSDTSYDEFVKVEYGPGITPVCERDSKLAESVAAATYHYHLRPDNVASSVSQGKGSSLAETVTKVKPVKNGTYYYMVSSNGTSGDGSNSKYNLRLVCDIGTTSPEDVKMWPSYTILDPTKYTKPTLTATDSTPIEFFDDILRRLRKMDINSLFNYTYDVPDSDLIMYPLDSISFLDSNHPLNRFTICQYVINESKTRGDLVVVGRYK